MATEMRLTDWTIHKVNAVFTASAAERPALEFGRVIEMQDSRDASHWPVRFYAYLRKP